MPRNNKRISLHAQRLKAIRPYINFNYDLRKPLSKYQKSKIKKYWDEIEALTARPFHVYRPRTKDHLQAAQDFAQHENRLPGLKVAFIPTSGKRPRIRFNNAGDIVASTDHITTRVLKLRTKELIKDPEAHVNKIIKQDSDAKRFSILCGRYEIANSYDRATVGRAVARLTARYDNPGTNNFHGRWLHGLAGHHFQEQASFEDFQQAKNKAKKELQKKRRAAKRRARYAKSKGRR